MHNTSQEEMPKHQWHFMLVLLPFILGIYLADYRNLTDDSLLFFNILSAVGFGLVLLSRTRQMGILLLFFVLGFWLMYTTQGSFRQLRRLHFNQENTGVLKIHSSELKKGTQKLIGDFYFMQNKSKTQLRLLLYLKDSLPKDLSQIYALRCKPERIRNETYPGAFDQERYYQLQQISHRVFIDQTDIIVLGPVKNTGLGFKSGLLKIKTKLSELFSKALSPRAAAIARALIIGERDGIDQELRSYFLATGAMHILAVSGMHIGLLILALLKVLALFSRWVSRKQALILVVLIVWYYAILTGLSASVLRSVFMFSVLLLSQLSGRQISNLNALFFSAFCLLLYDPLYLFDLGFQLSYLAMLGIYLYYELIKNRMEFKWRFVQQLWDGTALGLAATLTTLPLSLYHFHLYPNYAQIANLCLMSLSSFILILGMFFPLLQALPFVDHLSAFVLETCIQWMLQIMRFFSESPGAIAKGFDLPFWWVLLFWLLTFCWFYCWLGLSKNSLKMLFLSTLIWMSYQKQQISYRKEICYYSNDGIIVVFEGNKAKAFGTKPAQKCTFLFSAIENINNCKIDYQQLKKGTTEVKFKNISLHLNNSKTFQLKVSAQKQTQKIKVF
jgi:ComEC/Rec2-related protein